MAFKVATWTEREHTDSYLFVLNDEKGDNWLWINIYVEDTLTEYALQFEDAPVTEYFSEVLFYPLPSDNR